MVSQSTISFLIGIATLVHVVEITQGFSPEQQKHHHTISTNNNYYFMSTKKVKNNNLNLNLDEVISTATIMEQEKKVKATRSIKNPSSSSSPKKKFDSLLPSFDIKACWSKAGIGTCFVLEETTYKKFDIVFDIGCTPIFDKTMKASHVVLSHAHLDHLGGLFGHARAHGMLFSGETPNYYIPEELVPKVQKARELFSDIDATCRNDPESLKCKRDKGLLNMNIVPVKAGEEIELKQKKIHGGARYYLRPFEVSHCGHPSYGYTLISKTTTRSLKDDYKGLARKELGQLVKSGVDIKTVKVIERIEALYTGDTSMDGLVVPSFSTNGEKDGTKIQHRTFLRQGFTAPLVMCELTYLLESERTLAKDRGHMNLFDIGPILDSHKSTTKENDFKYTPSSIEDREQKFVFYHLSTRGKTAENILQSMSNSLPIDLVRRSEVALASFPSVTTSKLMKDNGCISIADYIDHLT